MVELSRRQFLKVGAGGLLGLYVGSRFDGFTQVAEAAIPGGTVDLAAMPKFTTPLLIPPVMPKAGTIKPRAARTRTTTRSPCGSSRSRSCRPGCQRPRCGGTAQSGAPASRGLLLHNAPSLTIEAQAGRPVRVKWINELVDANGKYLPHLLPVDQTLHWANPPGGSTGRDTRPTFTRRPGRTQARCRSSRTCTGRSAWATRATGTRRPGTSRPRRTSPRLRAQGHLVPFLRGARPFEVRRAWGPGFATFQYPNDQRASTDLVPRPRAGHDAAERVRRPRRVLHHPRRARRRRRGQGQHAPASRQCSRSRAQGGRQVPAQQDVLRDPDRHPGPVVQHRRVALLPRHAGVLRRVRGAVHPAHRPLADLEPRVLRQHDHGQRQHLAVPDGGDSAATASASSTAASRGS